MKKSTFFIALIVYLILLASCGTAQLLEEAKSTADTYNAMLIDYNERTSSYNEAVRKTDESNNKLKEAIKGAQQAINKGEIPYDETTLEDLKAVLTEASAVKTDTPEALPVYEKITVSEDASKDDLKAIIEQAEAEIEAMTTASVPETPQIPDHSEIIVKLEEAKKSYEDSVQGLKQITAPKDDFVMERLQRVDTITAMAAVTEDHDPNGQLNKQGGYIGCIYFTDSRVNRSNLYIEPGDDVIDVGTKGGGAIEVFQSVEGATARNEYLASFDGAGIFSPGSHYVKGTCVIRTSEHLTATQQNELTESITSALIAVD